MGEEQTLGRSVLELSTDQKELDAGLDRAKKKAEGLEQKFKKISQGIERAGKAMTRFITLPLLGVGAAMVKAASDAEETRSKFNTVFRDQARAVEAWADTYAEQVNRGKTETMGFLATVQDLFVPLGASREAAAEFSKTVVSLSTDLGSFNNLPTKDVLRDIQSALVGNHETVRKYGVVITQARLNQRLYNMGIEGGAEAATELEKAQARLNMILEGTTDAQGDAIRTADSFANLLRGLKSSAIELAEVFGTLLLPELSKIVEGATEWVKRIQTMDEAKMRLILRIGKFAALLGPLALGITGVAKAVRGLGLAMMFLAGNPVVLLLGAIAAIGISLVQWKQKTKEQEQALKDLQTEMDNTEKKISETASEAEIGVGGAPGWQPPPKTKLSDMLDGLREKYIEGADAADEQTGSTEDLADATDDAAEATNVLYHAGSLLTDEMDDLGAATVEYGHNLEEAKYQAIDFYSVISEMVVGLGELWTNVGEQMGASEERLFRIRKAFALGQAIINTAQAVTLALATTGPVGAFLAGAAGLLQITAIAAQQVPSYAEGAYVPEPQLAVVGHGGGEWVLNQRQMADLRRGGGGTVIHQHIYGHIWQDRSLRNMARSATGAPRY